MPAIQSYNQYIYKDGEWLLVGVGGETSNTTYTLTKSGNTITLTGSDETTTTVTVNEISSDQSTKLAGIATGAQVNVLEGVQVNGTTLTIDGNKLVNVTVPTTTSQLTNNSGFITKSVNNLENYTTTTEMNTALGNKLNTSLKGAANGLAELDANGLVPSSQLPSYVDDVLEYNNQASFPETGETGKIYIAKDTNKTYRWSGTTYVEISASLALGTTSSTAFRGDYGNAAYTHAVTNKGSAFTSGLYKITTNAEGHVTGAIAVEKADITALGIPSTNTTYESKAAASGGTDVSLVTTGEKYIWNNKQNALTTQTAYSAKGTATKVPQITTNTLGQVTGITEVTITQPTKVSDLDNDAGYITEYTDTKNTAGATDSSSKLFLVGATAQTANPQTYSQDTAYVGTNGHLYSNSKQVVNLSDSQALTNKTYNGYTLAAASAKSVDTSISDASTSANLPTSAAVASFVEGKGYITSATDTKNTAGSTDTSSKIFLIGATTQAANPQTYSHDTAYVGTDGKLYSNSKEVVNLSDTQALTNKTYNGYTLAAASAKSVDTSISAASTSTNLPTSQAVAAFVEGKGYTTNTGTITKVQANGTDVASSGTANIPAASTSAYGVTKLSDATNSTSTALAATANAVKKAYDLAASKTSNTGTVTSVGLTAGSGISISGSPVTTSGSITVGHSNSITAQTTSGLYPIKIDAQGHITQYGEAYEIATEEEILDMLSEMGLDVYLAVPSSPTDYTYYEEQPE